LNALLVAFFLSLVLAYVYRQTHRGVSYSASFVHTMVLMAVTIALIMEIIGSNIARAFSLVGALSIIRFRTAIKELARRGLPVRGDGDRHGRGRQHAADRGHLHAVPRAGRVLPLSLQIGAQPTSEMLLKVHLPESLDYRKAFQEVFYRFLREHSLLSVETCRADRRSSSCTRCT
jgi:hypothetical protein